MKKVVISSLSQYSLNSLDGDIQVTSLSYLVLHSYRPSWLPQEDLEFRFFILECIFWLASLNFKFFLYQCCILFNIFWFCAFNTSFSFLICLYKISNSLILYLNFSTVFFSSKESNGKLYIGDGNGLWIVNVGELKIGDCCTCSYCASFSRK